MSTCIKKTHAHTNTEEKKWLHGRLARRKHDRRFRNCWKATSKPIHHRQDKLTIFARLDSRRFVYFTTAYFNNVVLCISDIYAFNSETHVYLSNNQRNSHILQGLKIYKNGTVKCSSQCSEQPAVAHIWGEAIFG